MPRLGEKAFEQAAGFLRISGSENPLDASAVHPEAYPMVERILADIKAGVRELVGDTRRLRALDAKKYTDERFGLPTVQDILRELEKPGRDPRPEFKTASFRDGVEELRERIAAYRRGSYRRAPLPREVWREATQCARRLGVYGASRALGVSCESLRLRVLGGAAPKPGVSFVEFAGSPGLGASQGAVVEVAGDGRARLTFAWHLATSRRGGG